MQGVLTLRRTSPAPLRGMQEQGEQVNAIVKRVTEAAEKAGAAVDAAGRAVTKQVTLLMNTLNSWSSH